IRPPWRGQVTMNATKGAYMKLKTYLSLVAVTTLPLVTAVAQSGTESQHNAASISPGAAEVAKLAQSGLDNDVILGFINHSQVYYNLTAADIVALKNVGVSSQAVTAMLNHDVVLHNQQLAASSAAMPTGSSPVTTADSSASAAPATSSPAAATTVVVTPPPAPAPQVEIIPVFPGPDYVWTPGWWSWNGGAWIWF